MRGCDGIRYLTAQDLYNIIKKLPPGVRLTPNRVGNLTLWAEASGEDYYHVELGFLDFRTGTLEIYEEHQAAFSYSYRTVGDCDRNGGDV